MSLSTVDNEIKTNVVNFACTNARSLPPKIIAMVENFRELDLTFFAITETWLSTNSQTTSEIKDLFDSEGITLLTRNRTGRGGGVAVAFDTNKASLKTVRLSGNEHEIICCAGSFGSSKRKLVIFTVYVPPRMNVTTFTNMCTYLTDQIEVMNNRFDAPFFVITGDFNRRDLSSCLQDFPEIALIPNLPTRAGVALDLTYTNMSIVEAKTLPPLESNSGLSTSDHDIALISASAPTGGHFTKKTFVFQPYTERGEQNFGRLLLNTDWSPLQQLDPSEAALELTLILERYSDMCFQRKTRTVKASCF